MAQFSPSQPVIQEDSLFIENPYPFYAWGLQQKWPFQIGQDEPPADQDVHALYEYFAHHFQRRGSVWFVFGFDECVAIARDHQHWTMEQPPNRYFVDPETGEKLPRTAGLLTSDPPVHTRIRSAVSAAFTPRMVARMAPRIREISQGILDDLVDRGEVDFVEEFCYPLPVRVIAEILGVPIEDRDDFRRWSDEAIVYIDLDVEGDGRFPLGGRAYSALRDYFIRLTAERRRAPQDDLISALVASAEVEGAKLTPDEIVELLILLLVAGNETTRDLIGNAVIEFGKNPDQLALVRANPSLIPNAVEEVLRVNAPVQYIRRRARADTEINGKYVRAGDEIILWVGAANRDSRVFSDPGVFDVQRGNANKNVTFGIGSHFCLGAPLARLETAIALDVLYGRVRSVEPAPNTRPPRVPAIQHRGVRALPLLLRS